MSVLIERGFDIDYTIHKIHSIKVVRSGNFQGNKYSSNVQFKSINVEQFDNEDGPVDKDIILIFKIPCEEKDLKIFNDFLRKLDTATNPLLLKGSLPFSNGKDTYLVNSRLNALDIMSLNGFKKVK